MFYLEERARCCALNIPSLNVYVYYLLNNNYMLNNNYLLNNNLLFY